ncbi:MAG: hypothetical protein Q8N93_08730, partial [Bacillota bacterium]|nr:hypothetical protein [Bacillota bacterium]
MVRFNIQAIGTNDPLKYEQLYSYTFDALALEYGQALAQNVNPPHFMANAFTPGRDISTTSTGSFRNRKDYEQRSRLKGGEQDPQLVDPTCN